MTTLNLNINVIENSEIVETAEVKNVSKMWVIVKELFTKHPTANIKVLTEDENVFKDLILKTLASGKTWMVDRIKDGIKNADVENNRKSREAMKKAKAEARAKAKAEKDAEKAKAKAEKAAAREKARKERAEARAKAKAEKDAEKTEFEIITADTNEVSTAI